MKQSDEQVADSVWLPEVVEHASHLLPAQGPLSVFIHHNTLHAFEHMPFEEAVVEAGKVFGCQPFMSEAWYRSERQRGRIKDSDLLAVVSAEIPEESVLADGVSERAFRLSLLRYPLHEVEGAGLRWHLNETGALWRFRQEVAEETRENLQREVLAWLESDEALLSERVGPWPDDWNSLKSAQRSKPSATKLAVRALWTASHRAVSGCDLSQLPLPSVRARVRHRDYLLENGAGDCDTLVNPFLIRFCAAFLDQGQAHFPMPVRKSGLFPSFLELYSLKSAILPYWLQGVAELLADLKARQVSALDCALESLRVLGVPRNHWPDFVQDTFLALKGWAGMVHQAHERPDRLPVEKVPAELLDFLAVRLVLERFALKRLLYEAGLGKLALDQVRSKMQLNAPVPPSLDGQAFKLFQVAQFLGISASRISAWTPEQTLQFLLALNRFDEVERRRCFHLAYERRFRIITLDALALHPRRPEPETPPSFQAVFCIDEREESTRRHLEETAPDCETFGTLGFFCIPMYFKAVHEPHPVALCPVVVTPRHIIREVPNPSYHAEAERRAALRRSLGSVTHGVHKGSHTLTLGGVLTSSLGLISAVPGLFRVLFPWLAGKMGRNLRKSLLPSETILLIERDPANEKNEEGILLGFSLEEMADIVTLVLENTGIRDRADAPPGTPSRFAPLIMIIGHGSSSLNNPHEAAHDCGACGGGRGGPNARAFAWMANHPPVRAILAERGLKIPETTRFVGAYHNTCDDEIDLYDLESISGDHLNRLEVAVAALQEARARDAKERCRRFESASFNLTPRSALVHVEERAEDLAQPRPEYGHATNAICVVGRRSRTRGLFMDRRPFLVCYDPTRDDEQGTILGRLLRAVGPVGAGINLEYYFSFVDNQNYGCGTKLPHNITGLLGVMDGYSSDLRTGLPLQMVEIHEPVRLLVVIETTLEVLGKILEREEAVRRLATNRWIQVAVLDPNSQDLLVLESSGWVPYQPEQSHLAVAPTSVQYYTNHREHLQFAEIIPGSVPSPRSDEDRVEAGVC